MVLTLFVLILKSFTEYYRDATSFFFISACACNTQGTVGNTNACDENGKCECQENFDGHNCDTCSAGHYNFPACIGGSYKVIKVIKE